MVIWKYKGFFQGDKLKDFKNDPNYLIQFDQDIKNLPIDNILLENEEETTRIKELLWNAIDNDKKSKSYIWLIWYLSIFREWGKAVDKNVRSEVIEERKDKLVKDMTDDEFDDMLEQLMRERKERKRRRESDMEM